MYKNRIAEIALKKGIRHSHIAKELGVSNQTFSRWVNNHSQPDLIQAFMIAKILHIEDLKELIEEVKE